MYTRNLKYFPVVMESLERSVERVKGAFGERTLACNITEIKECC